MQDRKRQIANGQGQEYTVLLNFLLSQLGQQHVFAQKEKEIVSCKSAAFSTLHNQGSKHATEACGIRETFSDYCSQAGKRHLFLKQNNSVFLSDDFNTLRQFGAFKNVIQLIKELTKTQTFKKYISL